MAAFEFVVIAKPHDVVYKRCSDICTEFEYSFFGVDDADAFAETSEDISSSLFIVMSTLEFNSDAEIAGQVQIIRQISPKAYIVVIVDGKMDPEKSVFVKKSGANLVLLETELVATSKLDFAASQKIKYRLLAVKVSELVKDTVPPCSLFHMLPMNRKFLPVIHKGSPITERKIEQLREYGEVYIQKEDVEAFLVYAQQHADNSAKGVERRARAHFLGLHKAYTDLALLIMDQSEHASYEIGKNLLEKCTLLATNLIAALGSVADAWNIINNTATGDYGSIERSPAIAAYSGLLSLNVGNSDSTEVMTTALLSDLGLLELHPRVSAKLRRGMGKDLHSEEREEFEKHPIFSLNRVLSRKLPLTERVKLGILSSHERVDGKGFPNRVKAERISDEASLVQVAELIDRACLIRIGEARPDPTEARRKVFCEAIDDKGLVKIILQEKLRKVLVPEVPTQGQVS